jgi:hypothetical protein
MLSSGNYHGFHRVTPGSSKERTLPVINTSLPARLREFLVSEGWVLDRRIEESHGQLLLTHPDHKSRQLCIPVDTARWEDWQEVCERAVEKVAEMTKREQVALWALIDGPTRIQRVWIGLRRFAGSAVVACALTVVGMNVWDKANAQPPVSITLAGCMDNQASLAVSRMSYDVRIQFAGNRDKMKDFAWTRLRALQTAANVEEMRKCYLEAQSYGHGFDGDGLIGDDLSRIEQAVTAVYSHIGATLVPGKESTDVDRAAAQETFRLANTASTRMSIRLGQIVSDWYL